MKGITDARISVVCDVEFADGQTISPRAIKFLQGGDIVSDEGTSIRLSISTNCLPLLR